MGITILILQVGSKTLGQYLLLILKHFDISATKAGGV